jgi:hypothetical protein
MREIQVSTACKRKVHQTVSTMADSQAKYAEINNYFKERMAESKSIRAARGKDARIAAQAAKAASGVKTWRQMKGLPLLVHEMKHVGNRPFTVGFG